MRATAWLQDLGVADAGLAGGKGANLGELTAAGLPVPPGFVVTSEAYLAAIEASGAREKLQAMLVGLDADDDDALTSASEMACSLVRSTASPQRLHRRSPRPTGSLGTRYGWRCGLQEPARTAVTPRLRG